ncbi:MAG: hypothetical protein ABWZ25_09660 [Chitinophagaceae bacterium]
MLRERLAVDQNNQLLPVRDTDQQPSNPVIRLLANLVSYVFHPLFIPIYLIWFLMFAEPQLFAGFDPRERLLVLIRFFIMYSFFPLVTVLLAKALGFLSSVHLRTQKERIIPYMACGIYYFWMSYVLRHQPEFAREVVLLAMSIFVAASIGLIVNIYMKVSMHAMAIGIMIGFVTMLSLQTAGFTLYMSAALLIGGIVCTARMIVSDHFPREIYIGLLTGIVSLLVSIWADGILP